MSDVMHRASREAPEDELRTSLMELSSFRGLAQETSDHLDGAITTEVVSRLLLIHRSQSVDGDEKAALSSIAPEEEDRFFFHILEGDAPDAAAMLSSFVERKVSLGDLLPGLLSVTARRFGTMWEEDRVGFAEVTLGLCTLHKVLREYDWSVVAPEHPRHGRRVLFATLEGEQHIFGAMIVAEIFRQASWQVRTCAGASGAEVCQCLTEDSFDLLGISAAQVDESRAAAQMRAFRRASSNPDIKIVVGGRAFAERPELYRRLGADAFLEDAESAPQIAADLHKRTKTST